MPIIISLSHTHSHLRSNKGQKILHIILFLNKTGSPVKHIGKLVLFSGRDGHVISFVEVPDGIESYYSPQVGLVVVQILPCPTTIKPIIVRQCETQALVTGPAAVL